MSNHLLVTAGLIIGLSACTAKQPSNEERFAQQALQVVRDSMKDPTSVTFKNVTVIERAKCAYGEALGKNSYGAYAGYQQFVYTDGKVLFKDPAYATSGDPKVALEGFKFMDKEATCSSMVGESVPGHVLKIPEA